MRTNALGVGFACVGCVTLAWLGLYGFAWNDYDNEARPAVEALLAGHLHAFIELAPAYGGSLLLRAPFAVPANLWGAGAGAVYRLMALPCLLASAVLAVWLLARMRARGSTRLAGAVTVGVCVANPVTLRALELGHPEELLGGALCVFAVLLAGRGRSVAAGAMLGLAIVNKEWALLAAAPVLLALPPGRRLPCAATAGALAAALLAPFLLAGSSGLVTSTRALASAPSAIFQPWQVWWFLGHHGPLVHGLFGAPKPGYRTAPAWIGRLSHPLVLLAGALLSLPLALHVLRRGGGPDGGNGARVEAGGRGHRRLSVQQALLALALIMLVRCLLDTWDTVYYPLPFILALLAWETERSPTTPPVLALGVSALVWASFQWLPEHVSADAQSALFLAWSLPLALALAAVLFGQLLRARRDTRETGDQEMTRSSLGSRVRTSQPSSVTTTRSSIRTPISPGR